MTETPRTYPSGVTSWIDVEQRDIEATKRFYGGLFGWTFTHATPPGIPFQYVVAQLDGQDVAGIGGPVDPSGPAPGPPDWNTYVAVDHIGGAASAVVAAGGQVISPPAEAGEGGTAASCMDPFGVRFRLWQARNRLGAQVTNVPGSWNFSDLYATDMEGSARFYIRLFGWELDDLGFATMIRRPGYGDHLASTVHPDIHERQSGVGVPPGFADAIGWLNPARHDRDPGWHVTFTVADRDETAALATSLGGQVTDQEDSEWNRAAVIVDPQGAEFTASQFTPPDAV